MRSRNHMVVWIVKACVKVEETDQELSQSERLRCFMRDKVFFYDSQVILEKDIGS